MSEEHHQRVTKPKQERAMNMSSARQKKKKAVAPGQAVNSKSPAFLRGAISTFILFHLIAITCWAAPTSFWLVAGIRGLVSPYMAWSGLFQSWDTFAPNPPTANSYVKAAVVTQDHRIHVWAFPRMEELSYSQRYFKERYRKFSEVMLQPNNAAILPDIAKHIARSFNSPTDPPEKVLLVQYQTDITPGADETRKPTPKEFAFYDDYVQPEDLK
jgi:hypothetical protein